MTSSFSTSMEHILLHESLREIGVLVDESLVHYTTSMLLI